MDKHDDTTRKVLGLAEKVHSKTLKVPLYRLKRIELPPRPPSPKGFDTRSVKSFEESCSVYSVGSFDSGLSYTSFKSTSAHDYELHKKIKELEDTIRSTKKRDEIPAVKVPPNLCSWDRRVAKKYKKRNRPPVNIIGCHQPSDLIIARADERVRKQLTAKEMRERHMSELSSYIDHLIQLKLTRGERYAKLLEEQKRQSVWLKIIHVCNYMHSVSPLIEAYKSSLDRSKNVDKAARYLQRGMTMWYSERVTERYGGFETVISKYKWRLQLTISIFQKRRASRILRSYLVQRKDKRGQMSSIIHTFITGVRRLQRMARAFLECKLFRLRSLDKIWTDLERQYIVATMALKREEVNQSSASDIENLVIDKMTKIEMDKQNDRWDYTSKRFDRILELHRQRGDLDVSLEAETIDGLLTSYAERKRNLEEMLREKRKEHILKLQDMQRRLKTSCKFSEADAQSFLKGDMDPGFRVNLSENAQYTLKVLCPFNVYKALRDETFLTRIRQIHERKKTFEITPNNVHLFNAALQSEGKRGGRGERMILRRSASMNTRSYEQHESVLRGKLNATIDEHQKEKRRHASRSIKPTFSNE